jgi:hypothetical protein
MRLKIKHRKKRVLSPLTPYVHLAPDEEEGEFWSDTPHDQLTPPLPPPTAEGFKVWVLEHRGRDIHFISLQEVQHAVDVLGTKILPSPRELGKRYKAVNSHWMSRLHTSFKPWKVRQEMISLLQSELDKIA